jgi:hypothetical protein
VEVLNRARQSVYLLHVRKELADERQDHGDLIVAVKQLGEF